MSFGFTREFFVPKGSMQVRDKNSDAMVYVKKDIHKASGDPRWHMVGFCGKRNKPDFNVQVTKPEHIENKMNLYFKSRQSTLEAKRASRQRFSNEGVKVGDVFVRSWGYDQTNVNAYEVVKLVGKASVDVVEIALESVNGSEQAMSDRVVPVRGTIRKDDEVIRSRCYQGGDTISVKGDRASKWDGKGSYHRSWYH